MANSLRKDLMTPHCIPTTMLAMRDHSCKGHCIPGCLSALRHGCFFHGVPFCVQVDIYDMFCLDVVLTGVTLH